MDENSINFQILSYLFSLYKEKPAQIFDISKEILKQNGDIETTYNELLNKGYIRNSTLTNHQCLAQITVEGIKSIAPEYLTEKVSEIIKGLIQVTGKRSVMEILKYETRLFQKAYDVVQYAEQKAILENSLYLPTDIFIKLSTYGKEIYEKHKEKFL